MAVCTVSRLSAFNCSKTLPGKKLVGTFEVEKTEDTEFPFGATFFKDNTGKIACHFDDFQPYYLSGKVAVTKWNFILNRLPNGRISSTYLEVMEVELEEESIATPKTGSDHELLERFQPRSPATISQSHESTHLIGKVHIKSVLQQRTQGESIKFSLTLVSNLLANLRMHTQTSSVDFVYEFDLASSTLFHIEDKNAIDYLAASNLSTPHDSHSNTDERVLENPINIDYSHTPFFTYKGTITCIIDNVLGVFALDSRYILHLGLYSSYNCLLLPYRIGVSLLLYNIHAVPMKLDRDIWKLSLRKNCPKFDDLKIIFVACFCSTIKIYKFPSIHFLPDMTIPRALSKFSLFLNNELSKLTDLLWIQKVYYEIAEKFPSKFDDITLLGNPLGINNEKNSLLSKLFQRYRVCDQYREWPESFFNHRFSCDICQSSDVSRIKFMSLADFLKIIEDIELPPNIFDGVENHYTFKVVSQLEVGLDSVHLMGVLQGNVNGELQLKDHTGQVLATNRSSIQQVQTYHLDNVWVIPEYDIVVENPGKTYIRFAIDRCFCFHAKPSTFPSTLNRYIFRVSHIHPTKLDYTSKGNPPRTGFNMLLNIFPGEIDSSMNDEDVRLKSHVEELNSRNESSEEATYFHFSGDSLRFLPAIHVGSMYELACASDLEKPEKTEFWLKNINAVKIRSIQVDVSKDPEHMDHKDLFDRELGPTTLQLDGVAKDFYAALEEKHSENKILNVSEVLSSDLTQISQIVSLQGYLVSKEFRATATLPKFIRQPPCCRGASGQLDASLLLRIRDLRTNDVVDVYVISTARYIIPLGLIPGQPLVLRKMVAKISEIGNVYCCSSPTTHISLVGFPRNRHTFLQELESTKLIDLHDKSTRAVYRIHCTITRIIHLSVQLVCGICEQVYRENSCPDGCVFFPPKFHAVGKFEIKDGTSIAAALVKDEHLLRGVLKLNDEQYQQLHEAASQKRMYYTKQDKDNLLNQVCTGSPIGREIILYCRSTSQQSFSKSILPNQIELSVTGIEEVQPELEALKYLQDLNNFYNA